MTPHASPEEWRRAALQARADLKAAPADLGLPADTAWVEWSSQANTIRWIDRLDSDDHKEDGERVGGEERRVVMPGHEWLERMADAEDRAGGQIGVAGLAADLGMLSERPAEETVERERLEDAINDLQMAVFDYATLPAGSPEVQKRRLKIQSTREAIRAIAFRAPSERVQGGEPEQAHEVEHEIELCARVLYRQQKRVATAWADADPLEHLFFRHLANDERAAAYREAAEEAAARAALSTTPEEK